MALVNGQYAMPDPLLSPGTKTFLESFGLGRWGLRAGRATRRLLRNVRDPVQHKIWMGQFVFPVRNLVLRNRPITISAGDFSVQMVPEGSTACDSWTGLRCERQEVSFILSVLKPGMTFFDVGANAGLFAVSAATNIGGDRVYAFEPCSSTCEILKQNLRLNRVASVHVAQIALGDSIGEGILQVNERGKDGLNTLGQASHPDSHVIGQESIQINTLDTFMREQGISQVDVMKVDIEGAELMLFRGAKELLQRADAPVILYEGFGNLTRGFGYHPVEILWLLESCGYALFTLDSDTGEIFELKPDYQYNSMVIAAKPGYATYEKLRVGLR
jgi:FkbM family methyltransferase